MWLDEKKPERLILWSLVNIHRYTFASRLTDDPLEAVLLLHDVLIPRESNY
jgi:hypothetical protein